MSTLTFFYAFLAVSPFDSDAFFLEEALVISNQFRQALERRRRLQHKCFHWFPVFAGPGLTYWDAELPQTP